MRGIQMAGYADIGPKQRAGILFRILRVRRIRVGYRESGRIRVGYGESGRIRVGYGECGRIRVGYGESGRPQREPAPTAVKISARKPTAARTPECGMSPGSRPHLAPCLGASPSS